MNHTTAPRGRLFALVARYPRTILALALLLSVASLVLTKTRMEFLTGRDDLMPRNAPFQLEYRAYREIFGDQDDIVVVAESTDAELTMRFCDTLHERLTKDSTLYREVFYPGGLPFFRQNGLLFAQLEDIQNLRRTLSMAAPVLKDLATSPSVQTLFTSLTRQINDYLAHPYPASLKSLTFMLTTLDKGFKGFDGKSATLSMDGFLKGGGGAKPSQLETAGRQQIITVLPIRDETSFAPAEKTIVKMRGEVQALLKKPEFKGISAGLTGVPVLEYEEMTTSQRDMGIATGLSLTLTVILLLIAFRGLLNVIAAMVSLIVAICVSFGFATIAVGHLNILSMVFAVMLIGLGIEYSIQVVLRYQEELGRGATHNEAIDTGLSRNLFSIIMAAATVALAFITFVFTDFKGIAELGVIAAGGIVICVITTFTVLPAMLVLMERFRKPAESAGHNLSVPKKEQTTFLENISNRPKLVIAVTLIALLAAIYPLGRSSFDYNMMNLQAKGLESVTYAYKLMRSKENSGYFGVAIARDRSEAAILTDRLEKLSSVDHVVSLLALVPADQDAKLAEIANLRRVMDTVRPVPYEENLRVMELPEVFEKFRIAVEKLKEAFEESKAPEAQPVSAFLTTLDIFFTSLEKEKDRGALAMLREFQESMFADLPAKLKLLKESLQAAPISEKDIPEQLRRRFVGRGGKLLLQIAPKNEIFEREPLQEFVRQIRSVVPNATGEPINVHDSMDILRNAYLRAFMYAFAGIGVILLITFRSIKYALLGILPLLAGLILMVGWMGFFGLRFNVANIIVMPLLLGVGIDSAIYIINRYRQEGETPFQVVTSSTGVGVLLNALTILFSFGALMVARHQGVFSIGAVMSLGMVASVAVFLAFLPALLTLWGKR